MRSDRHNKKNNGNTGFKLFTKVWSIFYLLVTIAFFGVLSYMDVLIFKYLCAAAAVVAAALLLTFPALFFKGFKKSRKVYMPDSFYSADGGLRRGNRLYDRNHRFF